MKTVVLNHWTPRNETVITETGYRFYDTSSVIKGEKDISSETEIGLFEEFYRLNNSLRYCNGYYYSFKDETITKKYKEWLNSDDYKQKSFQLYYGNGVVD